MKKLLIHITIWFLIFGNILAVNIDTVLSEKLKGYKHFSYQIKSLPTYIDTINDPNLSVDPDRSIRIKNGFVYLPVKILLDSGKEIKSIITLKVKLYQDVLMASRSIKSGEILNGSDFFVIEKDVAKFSSTPLTSFSQLTEARASRNINKEAILTDNMVKSIPIIQRGDRLNAALINGSVQISFFVTAREEGYIGENIKIVRDDRKIFHGKVIDSDHVIIE